LTFVTNATIIDRAEKSGHCACMCMQGIGLAESEHCQIWAHHNGATVRHVFPFALQIVQIHNLRSQQNQSVSKLHTKIYISNKHVIFLNAHSHF